MILHFTRRDPHHKNAKFGLVKFCLLFKLLQIGFLRKEQPFRVVFCFVVKGVGLEWRSANSCEAKPKQKSSPPPLIPPPTTLFFVEATCCRLVTSEAKLKGGDIALLAQSVAGLNLAFLRCGSRRLKFDCKKSRRSIAR